jgi:hypothetical protein
MKTIKTKTVQITLLDGTSITKIVEADDWNPCTTSKKWLHLQDNSFNDVLIIPTKQIKSVIITKN